MAYKPDEKLMAAAAAEVDTSNTIPAGYIEINLSTHGTLGAPASFHIRNFNTGELMDLALTDTEDLPIRVVNLLQDLVFEPVEQCDVKKFHEHEVEETLFLLYKQFYNTILTGLTWELTDEDKEQIAKESGGNTTEEYFRKINAVKSGAWKPQFEINLRNVKTYDIPKDFKTTAHVKKSNGFECEFTFPRYGDILELKQFIDAYFKEKDKRYEKVKSVVKQKNDLTERWEKGEQVADPNRIYIPENEMKEYKAYEKEKVLFTVQATIALHLKSIRGEEIENLPLIERIKYADDPELDHSTFSKISQAYQDMKIGLIPDIEAMDPILHKVVKIKYSFRVFTLLQAIRDNDSVETSISFE